MNKNRMKLLSRRYSDADSAPVSKVPPSQNLTGIRETVTFFCNFSSKTGLSPKLLRNSVTLWPEKIRSSVQQCNTIIDSISLCFLISSRHEWREIRFMTTREKYMAQK
jgi:hypothetical protein